MSSEARNVLTQHPVAVKSPAAVWDPAKRTCSPMALIDELIETLYSYSESYFLTAGQDLNVLQLLHSISSSSDIRFGAYVRLETLH